MSDETKPVGPKCDICGEPIARGEGAVAGVCREIPTDWMAPTEKPGIVVYEGAYYRAVEGAVLREWPLVHHGECERLLETRGEYGAPSCAPSVIRVR